MLRVAVRVVSIVVAWCLCSSAANAQAVDPSAAGAPTDPMAAITFGEAAVRNVDGWRETGRTTGLQADGRVASLGAPAALGERLVSVGRLCQPDGGACESVGWHSTDGIEWTATRLPGGAPTVDASAASPGRVVAVGRVGKDEPEGALWVTTDGLEWAQAPEIPPPFTKDVAVTDEAIAVQAMRRVWTSSDGTAWTAADGPRDVIGLESGPGGFLAWTGGRLAKDVLVPARAWHSTDGSTWTDVKLPGRLGSLQPWQSGLDLLALDDEWVMAPRQRTLKRSSDGLSWEQAPGGSQRFEKPLDWIIRVGDRYLAFGDFYPAKGMWSWRWDGWGGPDNLWVDEVLQRPLDWRGELTGFGEIAPEDGERIQVAWSWEGLPPIPSLGEVGLDELSRNGLDHGWGQEGDVIVTDDGLVALGSTGDWKGSSGAAWRSADGRSWRLTHLLPQGTHLATAVPLGDGTLLAFGDRHAPNGRHRGTWSWRLGPDGSVRDARRLPGQAACCASPIDVAGTPGTGMVALLGETVEILVKEPGTPWRAATVPGSDDHRSVGLVDTRSGLVVVANGPAGVAAWRSEDGQTWHGPELLPGSRIRHDRADVTAAQDLVYDEARDILLAVAYPDRVWQSVAGGPFEAAGPLPVALSDPAENDGVHRGVALADGFLVATSDSPLNVARTRLQMSANGIAWEASPPLRTALGESGLLEYDGRLLFFGGASDVMAGPASIEAYPTWPADVTP